MYGKIFDSMYDGTIAEDWRALITFQQMIVLCDADGIIDMTPDAISRRTGIPIEHIKAGIDILENPDPYSRTPDQEGRRIVRLDEHKACGWFLVNHQKYKILQDSDEVRRQNRERKAKQRDRQKNAESIVTAGHGSSRSVTAGHGSSRHTDTDTDTDKKIDMSEPQAVTDLHPMSIRKADHEEVIRLYHEILPELSSVIVMRWHGSKSAAQLGARWKESIKFRDFEFWRAFFETVRQNPWWMGVADAKSGAQFRKCNLAWLVKRENFDKVIQLGVDLERGHVA